MDTYTNAKYTKHIYMYIVAINIYPEVFFMEELLNFSSNNGTKVKVVINVWKL